MANRKRTPTFSVQKLVRTLLLIAGGITVCLLIPAIAKFLVFTPIFSLISTEKEINKSIVALLTSAVIVLSYYYFFLIVEKRKIPDLNLKQLPSALLFGSAIGFGIISLVIGILYLMGNYSVYSVNSMSVLLQPFLLFLVMGVFEEIIFRGIIFRIIEEFWGIRSALLISSFLFGFTHFSNSGFNYFSGIAISLHLGLLTAIVFSIYRNIWYPVFLHVSWNMAFVIYGVTVSGANDIPSYMNASLTGPTIISGGLFGPENSILTIIISLVVFLFLYSKKTIAVSAEKRK
ncbi:MAG: CPBP family intramembrane metalloprotease [Chlorobi bacterium]|nr:CPBP family intramembrane metalloprotease [Chlorobiota bacterium]